MNHPTPTAKRRRLDDALHKPFRSPLKTVTNSSNIAKGHDGGANNDEVDSKDKFISTVAASTASDLVTVFNAKAAGSTAQVPTTPARQAVRRAPTSLKTVGQTPGNLLHRPFTPSTLAHARTAAGINQDDDGSTRKDDDDGEVIDSDTGLAIKMSVEPEPEFCQDTPMQQRHRQDVSKSTDNCNDGSLRQQSLSASPSATANQLPSQTESFSSIITNTQSTSSSQSDNSTSKTPALDTTIGTKTPVRTRRRQHPKYPSSARPNLDAAIHASAFKIPTNTSRPFPLHRSTAASSSKNQETDPELLALEKEIRDMESQTRTLRSQIETLRSAEGLPEVRNSPYSKRRSQGGAGQENEDAAVGRLGELMSKWKGVSQSAAEQVFEDVRDRFRDIGGLAGYKRQERARKKERVLSDWAWEKAEALENDAADAVAVAEKTRKSKRMKGRSGEDSDVDGDSEDSNGSGSQVGGQNETFAARDEAKAALAKEVQRQVEQTQKQEADAEKEQDEEDEEFDMAKMLDMLNIEPHVIGWCVKTQVWLP